MVIQMLYRPLKREELINVVEGKGATERVPVIAHFWVHPETFGDQTEVVMDILGKYPQDAMIIPIKYPMVYNAPQDDPDYRWVNFDDPYAGKEVPLDERIAIKDWDQLEEILASFPDTEYKGMFPDKPEDDGRYRIGHWWFCLFERHWELRGMTNALMDYYTDPDKVHRLFRALTDFYMRMMERAKEELMLDAIFTSDDLGTQNGSFFSPEIFNKFFKPYYKQLIDKAHSLGMHFWLHACGCIEKFLPDFVDLGLDVIHPIQKYTMDEQKIAREYGGDICIWAGFDVQNIIPWGTAEEVRKEVRFMLDTYYRPEGKLIFTAGNGINGDCPMESLEAFYDEAFKYGTHKKSMRNGCSYEAHK